jgi:uncharacterized membrane protein YcjF (UPF0283 family)
METQIAMATQKSAEQKEQKKEMPKKEEDEEEEEDDDDEENLRETVNRENCKLNKTVIDPILMLLNSEFVD